MYMNTIKHSVSTYSINDIHLSLFTNRKFSNRSRVSIRSQGQWKHRIW